MADWLGHTMAVSPATELSLRQEALNLGWGQEE